MTTETEFKAAHAAAIGGAEQVVADARASVAASRTEATSLQAGNARMRDQLAADPLFAEFQAHKTRERNASRVGTLRELGLNTQLSEAQVLAIAPDIDPRDPDGRATFEAWAAGNPALFRAPSDPRAEVLRAELAHIPRTGLFNVDQAIDRHEALTIAAPVREPKPVYDVEKARAELVAASTSIFNGGRFADRFLGEAPKKAP